MEHGQTETKPQVAANPRVDPGDFVAEEARIRNANPNYIGVFVVLAILTGIEVGITTLLPTTVGRVPLLLALTIAKGLLVVLYYMHLKFDSRIYSVFFGLGVFAFAIPFVIALVLLMNPPHLESVRAGTEGGGGEVAHPTTNPNAGPPIAFQAEAADFFFKPDALSANSGQRVNVALRNIGSSEHNFTVPTKPKSEEPEPWKVNDGTTVAKAAGGTTGRGTFVAPAPGEYIFYCSVPGHADLGMHGTLVVK